MSKHDLLLEIGLEEIPARFILDASDLLGDKIKEWLDDKQLSFREIQLFSTPRRLSVLVKDVAESQIDVELEVRGPAKKIVLDPEGNWSKAAVGFTKSQGAAVDDIYFKEIKGVEYAHINKFVKGKRAMELFPELENLIVSLHFPNHMRWGDLQVRYIRPIQWLVALFGNEIIPFSIASVEAGRTTNGHRFLGEKVEVSSPNDYEKLLLGQYVIANYETRKEAIVEQISKLSKERNWDIHLDESLLEEVTNLVEYPTAFFGSFDENFLKLPEEVLITSMREHQRYFPVKDKEGSLLPYFIGVRNGDHRYLDTVIKGNEKVLRARLADGVFFYEEDEKISIDEALSKLETIVYHEKIGTLSEKIIRIKKIASELGKMLNLSEAEKELINRSAQISKFDLVTNMVNEFPELQGIMGEMYAMQKGEEPEVAIAIKEHYLPKHAEDEVPTSMIGSIVSIADKVDSIVSVFAIGLIPTGSQDPYALRRQAAGIIQILLEKDLNIPLNDLLKQVIADGNWDEENDLYEKLEQFFKMRIKYLLNEKGIRHDIVEAVLESQFGNIPQMVQRAETLQARKNDDSFKEIIESLSRVLNIADKSEIDADVNSSLFENEYEENLYDQWKQLVANEDTLKDSNAQFAALSALQPAISSYFDNTMVMADQAELKSNRLAQMKKLAEMIESYAAMNKIIVK